MELCNPPHPTPHLPEGESTIHHDRSDTVEIASEILEPETGRVTAALASSATFIGRSSSGVMESSAQTPQRHAENSVEPNEIQVCSVSQNPPG